LPWRLTPETRTSFAQRPSAGPVTGRRRRGSDARPRRPYPGLGVACWHEGTARHAMSMAPPCNFCVLAGPADHAAITTAAGPLTARPKEHANAQRHDQPPRPDVDRGLPPPPPTRSG